LQLCSACRGDYEDPDASATDDASPEREDDEEAESMSAEFPERRERR
jgi:hypothetical protein